MPSRFQQQFKTYLIALFVGAVIVFPSVPAQNKPSATVPARLGELEKNHQALAATVEEMNKRIGESGWKALDATTKLSSLQWQTYGFVLALLVAVSYGGWQGIKLLRDKLEADLKGSMAKHEDELRNSTGALAFGQLCMGFWNLYETVPAGPAAEQERKRFLEAALLLSTYALEYAEKLAACGEDKYNHLITNVKANHAYWLAAEPNPAHPGQPHPRNAEPALKIAQEAFAYASVCMKAEGTKYIEKWPNWVESYCYVLTRFGTAADRQAAKDLLVAVCNDVRVNPTWRAQIRAEYGIAA